MASNTEILIKRSLSTDRPASLKSGELAYSYTSNTIFIGTSDGLGTLNIGGVFYTSQIDNATSANTGGTLVRRDATGNASFNYVTANYFAGTFQGNSDTATALQTARDFSINGSDVESSAVSFDGTGNVVLQGNLKTTGVTAGTYGGQTEIPVFTVDDKGRISSAANVSVATTLNFAGDSGSGTVDLLTDTLTIAGGAGITSTANDLTNTVTFDVDDTVLRTNTAMLIQTIDGDVQISGNLTISGNVTSVDVQTLNVADPLIYLAANNYTSDVVDIGFVGNYYDGATQRHAGVYRHAGDKQFYIFDNYDQEPTANVVNPADPSFRLATLHANLTAGTANANTVYAGTIFTSNRIYGDTSNNTLVLAPSTNYGPGVNDQYIIIDPTAPNHIHLRAGGTIDGSAADLYLGGEDTGVQVTDSGKRTYIRANTHLWTFDNDASTSLPGNIFAANIPNARTSNLVYFDSANGRFSYADDNALTPTSIANGSYSLSISDTNGMLTTNGAGLTLANGAIIKDTSGNAVAFGENAGTLSQGQQAVAIGDSAGYNTQGDYAVAIGYGAGNVSQGQTAVAIGINAGMSNQGYNGIAIGNSSGSGQGTGAVALGYAAGGAAGNYSISIGDESAKGNTSAIGSNAIAIGRKAGYETAFAGSIILNASGNDLSSTVAGLFINPVRYTAAQDATYDGIVFYNSSTKEVRYSYALDGGSF